MRATTVVALVLAITVQSAYSHLGLNLGFNTQKSLNLGGVIKGILGEVEVEKSLDVNIGHGNGINIQREGMISLGGGKWGFQKSGSISIGGGHGGISTTGKREGSINIEGGQNVYTQGQQSQQVNIHNKGHFQQNGGYEIGAQGSLNQNSGNYGQHSSVQNYHHGSSSSHFEQGQQNIPNEGHLNQIGGYEIGAQGSLTQNSGNYGQHTSVQNSHHGSSSSHFEQGQQSIPNEGHLNQIGGYEIGAQGSLTQNSGNYGQHSSVQNSHHGSSSSHFEQGQQSIPNEGHLNQIGGYEIGVQGSLTQNLGNDGQHSSVQNSHHGSSSSHFEQGQKSIPSEGHLNQIGGYEIGVQGSLTQNSGNYGQHSSVQNSHHGSSSSHFEQGQKSIPSEGHLNQIGGYEIGVQGSLTQNSGNYGQHSSVQNSHHGSSSSHFEQGQKSIPSEGHLNQIGGYEIGVQGSLTQNLGNDGQHSSVQNSHHGSSSSHFEQGQKSIPNEGHLNQIGGYEIGVQGILTQNSGNYGQHSSVQNSHLGSSSSHFEQGEFHQPGSGQITGHVQSQNVNFGQQGFEQSGHGQIGDIFSVNEDKKSGNVHISEAGESKIHVQQQGNKESSLGQITGHSGHQTGQIIYELNTPGQKDDNVQTGHVEKSNVQFGQRGIGESDHTHGKVENSKQAGDIIVVIKDQNGGKVHTSNDKNSNIHFGHGIESNYDQIVIDGSKQAGDIIVVIKDKNSGKVDSSHDGSKNIHFKEEGVAQSVLNQVTGSSEHKTNDHNLVITGENSGTVHNSQESNKGVTGHSEDKTNDYDFKLHGQDGENVHKIVNQNSKINSEHGSGRGQSQLEQNQFQSQVQLGQGQVHQQSQSGLVQGQVQTQFQLGKGQDQKQLKSGDNQFQSQVQLGQGQVQQQSKSGLVQGQVQTQFQLGKGQDQKQLKSGDNQFQSQVQLGQGQVQQQLKSGLVQGQVQTQFQLGKGKDQKQLKSGDNQFQSQVQFGTGKGSKGSGLNQIFGFHKAGEILFGFEKPIGHDGHNEIEYNSNRQLNVNRKSPEEESIDVTSSVTDNKNSLVVLNEDEHTSNIKMGVNNQNSAKKSISEHGNEHSSIGAVGHHAIGHDSTGQMQVTKEMLNSEEKSHHSESSESSSHFKQGLWNLGFGYNKKVEKQSKVEVNHHQESSSSVSQSHSSVQNHSQSSHKSSFHVESSHSSNKFH